MGGRDKLITIPQEFATATILREGDVGRKWIRDLPERIGSLCHHWGLKIDGPIMYGYLGLVIPVKCGEEPCALKVSWIDEATAEEPMALKAWNGQGAVQLLAADSTPGALLLERLDHRFSLDGVEILQAVEIAGSLLRRLAITAPSGFRDLTQIAQKLGYTLPRRWEQYGRPIPNYWMEQACELAAQLGTSRGNLLVNYDLTYDNVLKGKREPWLIVDPKVVIGDLEFGIAQLLWCRLEDIEANGGLDRHFHRLIEVASMDPDHARSWTIVRCMDYWLWALSAGLTQDPARCEVIVNWLFSNRASR